jgi:superfamily II DNA or RNA helicase
MPSEPPSHLLSTPARAASPTDTWDWGAIRTRSLPPASSEEEYQLHLAALEWGLDPAILINKAEDIQARKHWEGLLEPFEHQVRNLITFCRRAPVALIADDVGLGKTISAGLILSELMARGKVNRALILAPKILGPQWKEELRTKFQIESEVAAGAELLHASRAGEKSVITTYQSARNRMPELEQGGFDMLILDEAHHLRNLYGTANAPIIARALQKALKERSFRYVLMLTATPIHNRLWDIYSLIDLLTSAKGHANPLGNPDRFVDRYVADGRTQARELNLGRRDEFRQHLSQYMVRTRRADCGLAFPERTVILEKARPSGNELALVDLAASVFDDLNALAQISLAQALMSSPAAFIAQLENMCRRQSGPSHTVLDEAKRIADGIGRTGKEKKLLELLRSIKSERPDNWRAVIFTGRKETQRVLSELLQRELGKDCVGFIRGGAAAANQRTIEGYTQDPPRVHIVISTDAGAEGVNLQKGNIVVNYDLPWNPMKVEQRIGRVQRLGSSFSRVFVMNLVLVGSVEERVVGRLAQKLAVIAHTIGDLEGVLESLDGGGDSGGSFQQKILGLVRDSFAGRDTERAVRLAEQSVERARQIYEEEKANVDERLGRLDLMHEDGPRMPELFQTEPRLSEQDFTLGALRAAGGKLEEAGDDMWIHRVPGHAPEQVHFSRKTADLFQPRGFAGGPLVKVYRSGQPAFEKLVGSWGDRAGHRLYDLSKANTLAVRQAVREWEESFEGLVQMREYQLRTDEPRLHGAITVRAATSVAHDKYEKLVRIPIVSDDAPAFDFDLETADPVDRNFHSDEAAIDIKQQMKKGVMRDSDICAFNQFYLKRMDEELQRAQTPELQNLARQSFTPSVSLDLAGVEGHLVAFGKLEVEYLADGVGPFRSTLTVVPNTGQVLEFPATEVCGISNQRAPSEAIAQCCFSGKRGLASRFVRSPVDQRTALPEFSTTCEESGAAFLQDELTICAVTGKRVATTLTKASAVSGKRALAGAMARCEFSGVALLPQEVLCSDVSGKSFRMDELATATISGKNGHKSEFVRCTVSSGLCTQDEIAASDVSGSLARADLLRASEKNPTRKGLPSEIVICAISGKSLLIDETDESALSGLRADKSLMGHSASSRRPALPSELVICEESGATLLPEETDFCVVSGKTVDARLLGESELSGARALRSKLATSKVSGRRALPSEMVECEISGVPLFADERERCVASGKMAARRELVSCDLPPGMVDRKLAVHSQVSGRVCASGQEVKCAWTGTICLPDETQACRLSKLWVVQSILDGRSTIKGLKTFFLNDLSPRMADAPELADLNLGDFGPMRKLSQIRRMTAPSGAVVYSARRSGFLGLTSSQVLLIYSTDGDLLAARSDR